jgi:hypothetical protein
MDFDYYSLNYSIYHENLVDFPPGEYIFSCQVPSVRQQAGYFLCRFRAFFACLRFAFSFFWPGAALPSRTGVPPVLAARTVSLSK